MILLNVESNVSTLSNVDRIIKRRLYQVSTVMGAACRHLWYRAIIIPL